ncbi:DUF7373 family lipoprotein [Nocardia huaxiensis]|uniref:Lipoprotein n=1 Tax=Nocardia huaxiensis TaxID=2755382 RepID=A0A7D6VCR2_9NOCA|nr:hypothetical protein [Nocardia huaxiensis]QLY31873.1 hypothetical protein H0264_06080 [Nocardia huaxiensis]UFS95438.1 hypothetical protein LPY97_32950 [Nocardia huaxiensis]
MAWHKGIRGSIAIGALAATVLTGCATISGTPAAGEIDVRALDIGSYPVEPLDYRREYNHRLDNGAELAVMRLAGAVANGLEIDPALKYTTRVVDITSASRADMVLAEVAAQAAERHGMQFGYSTTSSTHKISQDGFGSTEVMNAFGHGEPPPDGSAVNLTVLQFPDQDSARTAAIDMEAADFAVAPDLNERLTLTDYPDAKAHWRPGITNMAATLARGNYVINVFVQLPEADSNLLRARAQQVLAVQLPLLDALQPLSAREVLRLDYDPEGMLRRTLHPEKYMTPSVQTENWLAARAFLHGAGDMESWRELLGIGGVDYTSTVKSGGMVLRARDETSATALSSAIQAKTAKAADAPEGVPDSWCNVEESKTRNNFYCMVRYDRYVARVTSTQLKDAHQRAAAQYALLANAKAR